MYRAFTSDGEKRKVCIVEWRGESGVERVKWRGESGVDWSRIGERREIGERRREREY